MSLVPRNAPCPCGSGLKYKRCCIDREPELARKARALGILSMLGTLFPLMRPCGGDCEEWLAAHATPDPNPETIETGVSRLTPEDQHQVVEAFASQYPDDWRELVVDAGGTETAEESAVAGALGAALREARMPDQLALDLLDDDGDAAKELALAIDATNLWSIDESSGLDEVLLWTAAVERVAERLWTDLHARRLNVLVRRLPS